MLHRKERTKRERTERRGYKGYDRKEVTYRSSGDVIKERREKRGQKGSSERIGDVRKKGKEYYLNFI